MRKMKPKLLSVILSLVMVITSCIVITPENVQAANASSKVELWIGDTQEVAYGSVELGSEYYDSFGNRTLYELKRENDWTVYGEVDEKGKIDHLYIRANNAGRLTLPGVRIIGSGNLTIFATTGDVTLNPYSGTGQEWDGYAVYSDFYKDPEHEENPSDKMHVEVMDGAIHYNNESGVIESGSSLQTNGIIKCTSFSIADLKEVNLGSSGAKLPYAFELAYKDNISQTNGDSYKASYWEIELQQSKINAYVTDGLCKAGGYQVPDGQGGNKTEYQGFESLWVYNEADLVVTGNLGAVKSMKVMTGGSIEATDDSANRPRAISSYFAAENGSAKTLTQSGGRITDFADEAECSINPSAEDTEELRYTYSVDGGKLKFASTSSLLGIVGFDVEDSDSVNVEGKEPNHGHFEVVAASGVQNEKGCFWAEMGTKVVFKMVPDAGYQYKVGSFKVNGFEVSDNSRFRKTENIGEYEYTMGANACNLTCEFEKVNDTVNVDSDAVGDVTIDMADNALAGSMELDVNDSSATSEVKKEASKDNATIETVLDLSLTQQVNTITGEEAWENPVSELDDDMNISLTLDDAAASGTTYEVIRVHDGSADTVNATYKDGKISFETDRFSKYAIAVKKGLALTESKVTLATGNTLTLKALTGGKKKSAITWKSSNAKVASVNKSGKITAVKAGSCKITATVTIDGKKYTATTKVTVKAPSITVKYNKKSVTSVSVKNKKSITCDVTVTPAKTKIVLGALSANDKKIAAVTYKNGKLTIKGKKKGKITVKLVAGKTTKKITVTVK